MKSCLVYKSLMDCQDALYARLNKCSMTNGRLCALPVAILDVAIDVVKTPLSIIEAVAMAAINLIGLFFQEKCNLKDAIFHAEMALAAFILTPLKVVIAPVKITYQFLAILYDPKSVQSIDYRVATYKEPKRLIA